MTSARVIARVLAAVLPILSAGCSASDPTAGLSPAGDIAGARLAPMNGPAGGSGASDVAATSGRLPASIGAVQFLPVVGAPSDKVEILAAALSREAERAGVSIAPSSAPATPLRLKGYLSALGDGGGTVVVYVWDVVDPQGNRVSRIQGQERAATGTPAGDPWAGVGPDALGAVAARTIDALARRGSAG